MRFSNSNVASVAAITSLVLSPALVSGYNITKLETTTGSHTANNTIDFLIFDPAPYSDDSNTTCKGSWAPKAAPPGSWQPCTNSSFSWMFGDFEGDGGAGPYKNGSTFGLSIQHSYIDPPLGPPPYNVITTFGRADVNNTVVHCSKSYTGSTECSLKKGEVFPVPVIASSG